MRTAAPILLLLILPILPARPSFALEADLHVPRWQSHDFTFKSDAKPDNPFDVPFAATLTGPRDTRLELPGFYDGNATWTIRFSPTEPGEWTLRIHSNVPSLDNKTLAFSCIPNPLKSAHGPLKVDPAHPHHFVYEDGTPYFLTGYECDWLWALDAQNPALPTLNAFLDKLAEHGFNYVILNAYAHDTTWRKGNTAPDDYGPPPLYAWAGTNDRPDHSRFNLAFWQHYDRVIDALNRRGIQAHVMIKVYNKLVNWPPAASPDDDRYFRWLIARYAAYPNVHWDFSKEANNEKSIDYKTNRIRFIKQTDPYHRLLTVHDDRKTYDDGVYDGLLDYRSDQQHSDWRRSMLAHRRQHAWPVVNTEFGYEHGPAGPADKTYNVVQPPDELARRAWQVVMAGGYPVYYYTYTAWDVLRPDDTPPGYAHFKRLADFFASTRHGSLEPAEGVTTAGVCLADRGHEYVVFLDKPQPFSLKLDPDIGPCNATWFQPLTGQTFHAPALSGRVAPEPTMTPPKLWGDGPVVLHVVAAAR